MLDRAMLIAVEGGDGAGKSTQAARLAEAISAAKTREPGGTAIGERVRELLVDRAWGLDDGALDERAELFLVLAARAQHVAERIRPWLEAGRLVVVDRFSASTIAYQGFGRGLPIGEVRRACDLATGGLWPDLTVLLDVPVVEARRRRAGTADRIEAEPARFHEAVRAGFLELAAGDPTWVVIDGSQPVGTVSALVAEAVREHLGVAISDPKP
ncbi:MAG: dTMP kinase [Acidimicrobiales bacterium]